MGRGATVSHSICGIIRHFDVFLQMSLIRQLKLQKKKCTWIHTPSMKQLSVHLYVKVISSIFLKCHKDTLTLYWHAPVQQIQRIDRYVNLHYVHSIFLIKYLHDLVTAAIKVHSRHQWLLVTNFFPLRNPS